MKSLCIVKEAINRTKTLLSEWEKIFANEATDKGLISKIYKQLNVSKPNNPMKNWEKHINRRFPRHFPDG